MLLYGGDVDVIDETKFRARSLQLDELLRGDYRSIAAELRRVFPRTRGLQERYVPLVQRYAHELSASLYARPVVRRFGNASTSSAVFQKLRRLYAESQIDRAMLLAHRELLVQQTIIIVPIRQPGGEYIVRSFSPWQFSITYGDLLRARDLQSARAVDIKVPVQNEAGAVVYGRMHLDHESAYYEVDGGVRPVIGDDIAHGLGMIPAVGVRSEAPMPGRFESPINDAILNAAVALMISESDTELLVHTQAWGQRVLQGAQMGQMVEELQVGPEKVLALYSMDPSAPAPELKIVQGHPPLSQITNWNESRLRLLCSMFDLSPDAFLKNNTSTTASARSADARDRADASHRFISIFEGAERDLLRLIARISNTIDPVQIPVDIGIALRFARHMPYADPLHEAQAMQLQMGSGTLSPVDYLMSRDGLSRAGAISRIKQNLAEIDALGLSPAAAVTSPPMGGADG